MPQLTVTAKEIVEFVQKRNYLSDRFQEIHPVGDEIHATVKVMGPFSAKVRIRITDYTAGLLTLTIKAEGLKGTLAEWISPFIELGDENIKLNMPELKIDINKLINKYAGSMLSEYGFENIIVDDIQYSNGEFRIDFSV